MSDFGDFFDSEQLASEQRRQARADEARREQQQRLAARKENLAPILAVAIPVLQKAEQQLALRGMEVSWSENTDQDDARPPVLDIKLKMAGRPRGIGKLSRSGDRVVVRYEEVYSPGSAPVSIGNTTLDLYGPEDVERLIRHCISAFFPKT